MGVAWEIYHTKTLRRGRIALEAVSALGLIIPIHPGGALG